MFERTNNLNRTLANSKDETILANHAGVICYMNAQACEKFGYALKEPLGGDIKNLLPEISFFEMEEGVIMQLYGQHKRGHTFPLFFRMNSFMLNNEVFFLIVFHDVKDHTKLRKELAQPLNELIDLKFALDESAIVAFTDRKGIIKYVNKKFCEVSKYPASQLIGQDHRVVNSGYHSKEFFRDLWRTISSGKVWKGEIKNRAKDGSFYWVDTTIVPFIDDSGKPYQYLAIRYEITDRKKTEEDLQDMMAKIMNIQEDERRLLSRNLHDGIGQNLYSHLITISRLQSEVDHPLIEQMMKEATELIEEVREISWELRPSILDDLGLLPAIRTFLTRVSDYSNIDIHFDSVLRNRLEQKKEVTVYRIIQEALTNIRKYAEAGKVEVTVRELDQVVRVLIEDDGKGFDPDETTKGVGLFSMEERARAVGGNLQIHSTPGQGTKIVLEIPVDDQK